MAEIEKQTIVTLTNAEICEAICHYAERLACGDMPAMNPETVRISIPSIGSFYIHSQDETCAVVSN